MNAINLIPLALIGLGLALLLWSRREIKRTRDAEREERRLWVEGIILDLRHSKALADWQRRMLVPEADALFRGMWELPVDPPYAEWRHR